MGAPTALCPDKRGSCRCVCHGTFLFMKNGAGWIRPIEEIDHPCSRWNRGDIYITEKDLCEGVSLEPGDSVVFYLYVDAKGLGAEQCAQVWSEAGQAMRSYQAVSFSASDVTTQFAAVDLSCLYHDFEDDDEDASDSDSEITLQRTKISLADCLVAEEPKEPPSKGSALHSKGSCKRCSFFPKGTCVNGVDCEFCHFEHDKRPKRHKRKTKKVQQPSKENVLGAISGPMKCEISSYLLSVSNEVLPSRTGDSTPTTSAGEGSAAADLADFSVNGSPPPMEREPCIFGGVVCMPPPGLHPPPPKVSPPPMPEFLTSLKEQSQATRKRNCGFQ